MRYLLIFLLSILSFGCSSVPKGYLSSNTTCKYNNPIFNVTEEELTLDHIILEQLKNKEADLVVTDNNKFRHRYHKFSDGEITNKQTNKQLGIGKWILYRKNGTAKRIRFIFLNGTKEIKEETHYDGQGNITKIIDYENGYNICWAEAIEIVKKIAKKDIKKYQITEFNLPSRVDLNKFPNERAEWGVSLQNNENYHLKEKKVYWIDGVTGKFLRTSKISVTYEK